jgi:uncharacterized membrane protein
MCKAKELFTAEEIDDIRSAISWAELDTSGEIRVHIEDTCPGDPRDRGREIFEKLGMEKTELRNGVLFYLAMDNRKFAIISDTGIQEKAGPGFFDQIKQVLMNYLREGKFADGLYEAITQTGDQLKKHFPHKKNSKNQLPDEVTFGVID